VIHNIEAIGDTSAVSGWRYLWLKYVSGFQPSRHCAGCLVGPYSKAVRIGMPTNTPAQLDEAEDWRQLYLCGVASAGGWAANMHLAVVPAEGETAEVRASTGTLFRITNARRLPIPGLAPRFDGRPLSFTTCRNWQFGVEHYGLRPRLQASAVPAPPSDRPATLAEILDLSRRTRRAC
jgi:hypothetical protein